MAKVALGLDFGTESVRAVLVDLKGRERGAAVKGYRTGQIIETLPGSRKRLPPHYALQDPRDWIQASCLAVRAALRKAGATDVIGVGVDFTSCTMLPTRRDGTPLCQEFPLEPSAWPKLWKHHGAQQQTDRINAVARRRNEAFLKRYGGIIGLEWFFPKMLETLEHAPHVFRAAEVWLEAGDWYVWKMVGGGADELPRSTCQAGYKAMWGKQHGYPSNAFLRAVHPGLKDVVNRAMPGRLVAPGEVAGQLTPVMAKRMGLKPGTPVSAAIIDAHAGVPGAGAAGAGTLVMVMGTSSCHMLNSTQDTYVPGVAGVVQDGILPGYFGYETGQAAVGDAFDWLRKLLGQRDFKQLNRAARVVPAGADGLLCLDWFNGCRTPLMDGSLAGMFSGLKLHHGPGHLYRALLEGSALGLRWIVDLLNEHGVPVRKYIATGGLPHHNPLFVQTYADVLGKPVRVHPSQHGPALGAAILGALAAGPKLSGFRSTSAAINSMAGEAATGPMQLFQPDKSMRKTYEHLYQRYREHAEFAAARA